MGLENDKSKMLNAKCRMQIRILHCAFCIVHVAFRHTPCRIV
jgi:hypothetical protein